MTVSRAATRRAGPGVRGAASPAADTARRAQTRQALLDAAAALFAERGYHETGVPDIVRAAGVSQGTFYQYFSHRRDVLMALSQAAQVAVGERPPVRGTEIGDRLRAEINWYLVETLRFTTLAKVWHDAAAYDREIAVMMREARAARAAQFATAIRQTETAAGIDPDIGGMAIVAMIEELAYRWFVEEEGPGRKTGDTLAAADTLSLLVTRALGLKDNRQDQKQVEDREPS
jgi:AcrR family transcriptional regulator